MGGCNSSGSSGWPMGCCVLWQAWGVGASCACVCVYQYILSWDVHSVGAWALGVLH